MFAEIPQRVLHLLLLAGVTFVLPLAIFYIYLAFLYGSRVACRIAARVLAFEALILSSLFIFFATILNSQRDITAMLLQLFLVVLFWGYLITYPIRRAKGGQLLLDIGRNKYRVAFFVIFAGIAIFFALRPVISEVHQDGLDLKEFTRTLWFLSMAALLLFLGFSRIQIREEGIIYLLCLIKWEKIEAYRWEGRNGGTLILKRNKRKCFVFREVNIPIPPHYRVHVDDLLSQKIPAKNWTSEENSRN